MRWLRYALGFVLVWLLSGAETKTVSLTVLLISWIIFVRQYEENR